MGNGYWKYKWVVWKATWNATKVHFGGWKILELVGASLFTLLILYIWGGNEITSAELYSVIAAVLGALSWGVVVLVYHRGKASYEIYREQRKLITKYGADDINVSPYYPSAKSVQRPGLEIKNNKNFAIGNCRCYLAYLQIDKSVPDFLEFPYYLAWVENDKLVWEAISIPPSEKAFIAVQTWDRITGAIKLTAHVPGAKDYGPATGIEIGNRGGLAIYRDRYYKAGFRLEFLVEGKEVISPLYYFELDFDGENIKMKRLKSPPPNTSLSLTAFGAGAQREKSKGSNN
jgi:hypothetical protein